MALAQERISVPGNMSGIGLGWALVVVGPFAEAEEAFAASLRSEVHKHPEMVEQEEQLYWGSLADYSTTWAPKPVGEEEEEHY